MQSADSERTSATLLLRLQNPADRAAWSEFVERYGPKIYAWCLGWKLQAADAEDITQTLLTEIHRKLKSFTYDPQKGRFRGWLRTVVQHVWFDFVKNRDRDVPTSVDSQFFNRFTVRDFQDTLSELFDQELFDLACAQVQFEVSRRDWQVFWLLEHEQQTPQDVKQQFDIERVATVYMIKHRVKTKLRQRIHELDGDEESPS